MKDLLAAGLLIQIFAPFLITCIFTLLGFFLGRWWGRRQGFAVGWKAGYDDATDFFVDQQSSSSSSNTWCGATKNEWTDLYESASGGDEDA